MAAISPPDAISNIDTTEPVEPIIKERIIKGNVKCEKIELGEIEPVLMGDVVSPVLGGVGIAQITETGTKQTKVHQFSEKMPEFEGGMEALFTFVNKNLKYPSYERAKNIQGNVYVRFVVQADGKITRPEILRTVNESRNFNKEVLRVIAMMPKWAPGSNSGKPVDVYMTLPIQFNLK